MSYLRGNTRPRFIYGMLVILGIAVLARAWYLQVHIADENLERAGWSTETTSTLTAPRGAIWDRYGLPLAESVEAYNLALDPRTFYTQARGREEELVALLSSYSAFDAEAFRAMATLPVDDVPRYMRIARGLAPSEMEAIQRAAVSMQTRALIVETAYRRYYPLRGIAGALVGFVDADGNAGRSGIERALNEELQGGTLTYAVARDASRDPYLLGERPNIDAVRGVTLELSIDARLQRYAEDVLAQTVQRFAAQEAMAVVTNVRTGELLAVATVPTFDPNDPFSHPEEFLWASHALSYAIEPGSTAKVLTYAAAMEEGNLRMDTMLDCEEGIIRVDDRTIRDTTPVDIVPAWKALQVSSNVCSSKVAWTMTDETHHRYMQAFGLGERPNVPISGAAVGILPSPPWIEVQQANISFGHAFTASILQLHYALSTVANDGVRMAPMLIKRRHYGDGRVETVEPTVAAEVVRASVAAELLRAMQTVVYEEDGTGKEGAIPGVRVAAKTGTARLVDHERGGYMRQYVGSFTGFFPAEDPKYGISVWVVRPDREIAYYGGRVAAPAFREIGREMLRLYGEEPSAWADSVEDAVQSAQAAAGASSAAASHHEGSADDDARPALAHPRVVPALVGMRASEALAILREQGLPVKIYGSGRVAVQEPARGELLLQNEHVILQLAPEELR